MPFCISRRTGAKDGHSVLFAVRCSAAGTEFCAAEHRLLVILLTWDPRRHPEYRFAYRARPIPSPKGLGKRHRDAALSQVPAAVGMVLLACKGYIYDGVNYFCQRSP